MSQLPRYQSQFAWLERYINKQYPGQEAASPFPFFFSLFASISLPLFPRSILWYTACICVQCVMCIRVLAIHLRDQEHHHSSRFLNSLRLLSYFLERKTRTRVGHSVRASSPWVASLISIRRLFVSFTFLFLLLSPSLSPFLFLS